jgi:hypothetical protein
LGSGTGRVGVSSPELFRDLETRLGREVAEETVILGRAPAPADGMPVTSHTVIEPEAQAS